MRKTILLIAKILLITNFALAQVTFSLSENVQAISPNFIGINGRSTGGPSWSDPVFIDLVEQLSPGTVRYPAGTQANYWDWRTGTFIEDCGKTSSYIFSIPMFVSGLPEETSIIYVVNMARPTPNTGIHFEASVEILKSEATLQLKINDMLAALQEFENAGKFPEAIELGNEFYFTSEHASIYASNPELYIAHCKEICSQVKELYPDLKILLITTKGGTTLRDLWNNTIFNAFADDLEFKSNIHAVVQHHYISDNYGDLAEVTNVNTANLAISEGIKYPREHQSDYEMVPEGISLWLTEYGATKENAVNTWASGLRAVAMTLAWLEKGDKIGRFIYHHITDDPEMINKTEMKLGAVGMAYGLLAKAALNKTSVQKVNISQNPTFFDDVEALYVYQFKNETHESVFILNLASQSHSNINLTNLFSYTGEAQLVKYWNNITYTRPTYDGVGIQTEFSTDKTITIEPYSVSLLTIEKDVNSSINQLGVNGKHSIFPTSFNKSFSLKLTEDYINAEIYLINVWGQKVYSSILNTSETKHFPNILPGIYFYVISTKSGAYSGKLIKN